MTPVSIYNDGSKKDRNRRLRPMADDFVSVENVFLSFFSLFLCVALENIYFTTISVCCVVFARFCVKNQINLRHFHNFFLGEIWCVKNPVFASDKLFV